MRLKDDWMKSERYIPQVREAAIPEEGHWAELEQKPVLVLSIPEWDQDVKQSLEDSASAWMYDRANNAYLFCFRLRDGREYAIAFPREHAGVLLTDSRAKGTFSLLVTAKPLQGGDTLMPYFLFPDLALKRHPQAGW